MYGLQVRFETCCSLGLKVISACVLVAFVDIILISKHRSRKIKIAKRLVVQYFYCIQCRRQGRAFLDLVPPNEVPCPAKLKYETLEISGVSVHF